MTTLAIGPSVYKSLPYDTVKDFAPVGLVGSSQFALIANPGLGVNTLPELIALIKSKNGQMSYGTSGASTPHHLFMELFLRMTGGTAQHVPYRGSVAAMTDVISGHIPFMVVDLAVAIPAINDGKVKVFGVTSAKRVQGHARPADDRGSRRPGLRRIRLVLGGRARRHAASDHRPAQRDPDGLRQSPRHPGQDECARHHAA